MRNVSGYFAFVLTMFLTVSARAGTYVVKGTVTASGMPVRYAAVTFFDSNDSSKQYSALTDSAGAFSLGSITEVKQETQMPEEFRLDQNYPNPFSSSTAISYDLNKQSDVRVTIYDVIGREIRTFNIGFQAAGSHGVVWNGRNDVGKVVAPGVYLYRLQANGKAQARKMLFGVGENANPVLLQGISPSQTKVGADQIQDVPARLLAGSETFVVTISNTDSTSPSIVPAQFGNTVVQSDTTLNFIVNVHSQAIVYPDSTLQIVRGFGGVNMPGWTTVGDLTTGQVEAAFGTGDGQIGLSILRIRVPYDSTQFYLEVPTAALADSLGAMIMATPWSPPPSMKSNDSIVGGILNPGSYAAFANYLKSFAGYMADHGAPLYAVSVQNEPDWNATYESCNWNATQMLNFVKNNAPAVGMKIIAPESYKFDHAMSDPILNDSVACANLSIVGGHIYGDTALQSYPLAMRKGKEVWMTEHIYNGKYNTSDDTWGWALGWAIEINDCMQAGMSAYVYWCIRNFCHPGGVGKDGYALSQFSRFIRPGFYRVKATVDSSGRDIKMTAYKSGSKVVIVVLNTNSAVEQTITIENATVASFTPYVTSAGENCQKGSVITVSNGSFTVMLDPSSITTFVSN